MGVHGVWKLLDPVGTPRLRRNPCRKETRNRCEHMDGSVHEGDARRTRRDGEERASIGLLPLNLQATVPTHQAGLRIRRRHACSQTQDRHCPS